MSVVAVRDLCHSYGPRRGIEDVSLSIEAGEIFGFLGPNGAGKSTTIRILMGLLKPAAGSAEIFGRNCWSDGPGIRSEVGYVAGDVRLYHWLTARRGLSMLAKIRHRELVASGLALAERFQLEADLPVRNMSRGTRQKLALVLALAHSPRLVILDEPTSGLDPLMQATLMAMLREIAGSGRTVVFSSHTLSEVETLCDHVAMIRHGRILEDSTIASLKERAPRRIRVALAEHQNPLALSWPAGVRLVAETGVPFRTTTDVSSAAAAFSNMTEHVCELELHGNSISFLQWAAIQNFSDVTIEPPSLDKLFHHYYEQDADVEAGQEKTG